MMLRFLLASLISAGVCLAAACGGDGTKATPIRESDAGASGSGTYASPVSPASQARTPDDAATTPSPAPGGDPSAAFYDPDTIPEIEIGLDAAAIAVLSNNDPATDKEWVHGSFKHGTTTFADVGVRRKGSSTFLALPRKAALKISFNKWVKGQRYLGLAEITLNNMVSDPTFLSERLAYHVFRENGVLVQRANAAHVRINGEDYGLYANVETPNKDLLARLFGSNAGTLYEVEFGSQWVPGFEKGFTLDVGPDTKADLTALFKAVKAAKSDSLLDDVATTLDTNAWLKFAATEAVVGHQDGYAYGVFGSHNYFMAGNKAGVFSLLPWSTDDSFNDVPNVLDVTVPRPADQSGGDTLLLRCKAATACWQAYKKVVSATLTKLESLELGTLATKWHAQIDALVRSDPKRETGQATYDKETTALFAWIAARPNVVRAQLGL